MSDNPWERGETWEDMMEEINLEQANHYVNLVRKQPKRLRDEARWDEFEVKHNPELTNDIQLIVHHFSYNIFEAPNESGEYELSRTDAAELIVAIQDALAASLAAQRDKEQSHE